MTDPISHHDYHDFSLSPSFNEAWATQESTPLFPPSPFGVCPPTPNNQQTVDYTSFLIENHIELNEPVFSISETTQTHTLTKQIECESSQQTESDESTRRTAREQKFTEIANSRVWKNTFHDPQYIGLTFGDIFISTRLEGSDKVPDNIYSTLLYTISVTASGFESFSHGFLTRLSLVRAADQSVVKSDYSDKSPFVSSKSILECAFEEQEGSALLKFKTGDLSFNKAHEEFVLRIDVHAANPEQTLAASFESPSIRIYARKPNKRRRRNGNESADRPTKRSRITNERIDEFEARLGRLLELRQNLDDQQRAQAEEMIVERLIEGVLQR